MDVLMERIAIIDEYNDKMAWSGSFGGHVQEIQYPTQGHRKVWKYGGPPKGGGGK